MLTKEDLIKNHIKPIDPTKTRSVSEILDAFFNTSFQSRALGIAYDVFINMLSDPDCLIFIGLAGALIPGGLRKTITEMIKNRLVDVIVSTGANVFHDIYEARGNRHYKGSEYVDDELLRAHKIVRVYDTYMDDKKINDTIFFIGDLAVKDKDEIISSRAFIEQIGERLDDDESFVRAAYKEGLPIFVPAICDSSVGIGLMKPYIDKKPRVIIDNIKDNIEISQIKRKSKVSGAIYIGGGVPKNYIQSVGPINEVLFNEPSGHRYAIQLTTDDPKWGGLSGCTFDEAKSWGKIEKRSHFAQVAIDVTIGLPFIVRGALEKKEIIEKRAKRKFLWERDKLKSISFE
ncbi:MAG: deoxyhypusine synthase [Deltaproteobacteria bacterium]|nr:deoxyhypusine synthase family protein [Deltaproteobacteria bacterium]RLA89085.1 MAG: deoxyhypusine synthase [Deltaproteobacteria bacterium]